MSKAKRTHQSSFLDRHGQYSLLIFQLMLLLGSAALHLIPILCEAGLNKGLKPLVPQGFILLKLKLNRYNLRVAMVLEFLANNQVE
jgi:hypothetical protein